MIEDKLGQIKYPIRWEDGQRQEKMAASFSSYFFARLKAYCEREKTREDKGGLTKGLSQWLTCLGEEFENPF